MSNHRNAPWAGLAAACLIFISLATATHLLTLVSFAIAIAGGGAVLAVASRWPSAPSAERVQVTVSAPAPPPIQFQSQPVTGVWLPSALADYTFAFAANVLWLPGTKAVTGAANIAKHEIIRRAREITEQQDPSQVTLIAPQLAVTLGVLRSDPDGQVQVKAESVQLQLPPEDQRRLDEAAVLRKQEGLWEDRRRYEANKRRYLRTDVLKDAGSAVVWWLAKHEEQPQQVAENIDMLTRLAHAANNVDDAASHALTEPRTPAQYFDAFLDSLDPVPDDTVRLMLTNQVARFVDGHDQKAADEMRRRHSDIAGGYWGFSGEDEDDTPPL